MEGLFQRYGYGVIVANRFLAGTRAIVSFFAGMSRMDLWRTTLLSAISAGIWNAILLSLGKFFAGNWREVANYLQLYSVVVSLVIGGALVIFLWRFLRKRRQQSIG